MVVIGSIFDICKVNLSFIRVTGKFVSFSLRVPERGGVVLGDGGGGGGGEGGGGG